MLCVIFCLYLCRQNFFFFQNTLKSFMPLLPEILFNFSFFNRTELIFTAKFRGWCVSTDMRQSVGCVTVTFIKRLSGTAECDTFMSKASRWFVSSTGGGERARELLLSRKLFRPSGAAAAPIYFYDWPSLIWNFQTSQTEYVDIKSSVVSNQDTSVVAPSALAASRAR